MDKRKILATLLLTSACHVLAETAIRSVDEQGNVTFSDTPVSGAVQQEEISINAPAPSEQELQEAQQREEKLQNAADFQGSVPAPDTPDPAARRKAAMEKLRDTEKRYQEAVRVGPGDRIGTASGGSRLTEAYQQRVRDARAAVDRARKELQDIR